jgi:uncharacterized protein (DUF2336 family)
VKDEERAPLETVPSLEPPPQLGQARRALLRRLIDVVALPSSMISPPDRAMAGDVLLDMLFECTDADRRLCSVRLAQSQEAPRRVLRYLSQCGIAVAEPLLRENESFDASDLAVLVQMGTVEHRVLIAGRRNLPTGVSDALVEHGEPHVVRVLLRNASAKISEVAMDKLLARSQEQEDLTGLLARRTELRPSQAMAMFWWADGETRRDILLRHAADRTEMIDRCADVFALAAQEDWADPVVRKTLQLIERRQRNRAALEQSRFESLEQAIEEAARTGLSAPLAQEIGYLSGIKPVTAAKILSDTGGEGLAVLCKATGLKRKALEELWRALRRELVRPDGSPDLHWTSVAETYATLTVAKAQTTLRYWNWSLSSAFSPGLKLVTPPGDAPKTVEAFSTPRRTAKLVFGSPPERADRAGG